MRPARLGLLAAVLASAAACSAGAQPAASPSPAGTTAPGAPSASASATSPAPAPASPSSPPSSPPSSAPSAAERLDAVPRAAAEPRVRFPRNPPAVGAGANAVVSPVPESLWRNMIGYSWTPGCPVGRSSLRYVAVNFWGFDGQRSRGTLVVHRDVATATARAFTALYAQRFRIRQMRPMDSTWGRNPKGPGADDYAAMAADNTSAFNCRYVGGQEARRVWSNHAYGRAVDVNDFENPYVDDSGRLFGDPYFVRHREPAPGVFSSSRSAGVRAFTGQGFTWGGTWSHPDYQHFDAS